MALEGEMVDSIVATINLPRLSRIRGRPHAPSLRGAKRLSNPGFLTRRDGLLRFARNDGRHDRQCLVPNICRASAGLAISRPARRAQAAIASINCPFDVTLVPSP